MICKFCKAFREGKTEMKNHVWITHSEELYILYKGLDNKQVEELMIEDLIK